MALTKSDLIEAVHGQIGKSKKEASDLVEIIFDGLKEAITEGDKIKISGFGNFSVKEKRARKGRNPQTGGVIQISARRVLTFKASKVLRDAVSDSLKNKPITSDLIQKRSKNSTETNNT